VAISLIALQAPAAPMCGDVFVSVKPFSVTMKTAPVKPAG